MKIIRYLYVILALLASVLEVFSCIKDENWIHLLLIVVATTVLVVIAIKGKIYIAALLGIYISSYYYHVNMYSESFNKVLDLSLWGISVALIMYEGYLHRKEPIKGIVVFEYLGYAAIMMYSFCIYAIAEQIQVFANAYHMDVFYFWVNTLRLLPIMILVCFYSRNIFGYIMSMLVSVRAWKLLSVISTEDSASDFYCSKCYQERFSDYATELVDRGLRMGKIVILYILFLVAIRLTVKAVKLFKERTFRQEAVIGEAGNRENS